MKTSSADSSGYVELLGQLLFRPESRCEFGATENLSDQDLQSRLCALSVPDAAQLLTAAQKHHVVLRALGVLQGLMTAAGKDRHPDWVSRATSEEQSRISNAVRSLHEVCRGLENAGCGVMVIKTLEHWPDFGGDLDLYTNAHSSEVIRTMKRRFGAKLAPRSWGDRLASKWNFILPALPEPVEVHVGRLGQTGEQLSIASGLPVRSRVRQVQDYAFRIPSPEDALLMMVLQRMYRHFYLRLCDIADTVHLLEGPGIDYVQLRETAEAGGIWDGTATYLQVVSECLERYRGRGLDMPASVRSVARFGGREIKVKRGFIRIPIMPHSTSLYASELSEFLRRGNLRSTMRLSLLPCLATAAAVQYRITGDDKGIW